MTERSLADWLAYLEQLHPSAIDLGLARVAAVADRMELRQPGQPLVIVAGTNGKGSTVAVLEQLALGQGLRPGVFTSPHLLRFNERIRVAGEEAPDAQICAAFAAIESARGELSLTYFEFAALAGLWVFRQQAADCLILEVGLGGRLDAVNILDADVTVITRIDLDHQQWLGDTREVIALEKAGVCRAQRPCVISDPNPPASLQPFLAERQVPCYWLGQEFRWAEQGFNWWFEAQERPGKAAIAHYGPLPGGPLLPDNVAGALQVAALMGWLPQPGVCAEILSSLVVPGRRQQLQYGPCTLLLDVAHNPAAVAQLAHYLAAHPVSGSTVAVFAAMSDKDIHAMIRAALPVLDRWLVCDLPGLARAAPAHALAASLVTQGVTGSTEHVSPERALEAALGEAKSGDRLVVFGSFHTVAAVLARLEQQTSATV